MWSTVVASVLSCIQSNNKKRLTDINIKFLANLGKALLEPQLLPKGFYTLGSVFPSVSLAVHPFIYLFFHPSIRSSVSPDVQVFLEFSH